MKLKKTQPRREFIDWMFYIKNVHVANVPAMDRALEKLILNENSDIVQRL